MGDALTFNLKQAESLLGFFGGDDAEITVFDIKEGDPIEAHSGPGLYAYFTEYPDEGGLFLGPFT